MSWVCKNENWVCKNCGWKGEYKETCTDIDGTHLCPECNHKLYDEDNIDENQIQKKL